MLPAFRIFMDMGKRSNEYRSGPVIILPLPPISPKTTTRGTVIQRMVAGSRLHEAPHLGEIDENDPQCDSFRLLSVHDFHNFDLHADFASSNRPLFPRGGVTASKTPVHELRKN